MGVVALVKKLSWELRRAALYGLIDGRSALSLGYELGVHRSTIQDWATMVGMIPERGIHGGVASMPMDVVVTGDPCRSYRLLTLEDQAFIHAAYVAHHHALQARTRVRPGRLQTHPRLRAEVIARLNTKCSPVQISARLKRDFPGEQEMQVSHETIYQALYLQGKACLRHELTVVKALRSGRTTRKPVSRLPARTNRPWLEGALLTDRPPEVRDRAVPGHWEGDLVIGPGNSGIVTLVERCTRYALIGRLPGTRDSATVIEVLQSMIQALPATLLRTITWDQGTEMAGHARFTVATGCPVFFCDPHSPWQRGTNENTNGLIRDFYPKGTNFDHVSDEQLHQMQELFNPRPRQTLDFLTPHEKLSELITGVALAN